MTPSQVAQYGSEWWLGPLFLVGFIVLLAWHQSGPWTARGKRNAEASRRYWEAIRRERFGDARDREDDEDD